MHIENNNDSLAPKQELANDSVVLPTLKSPVNNYFNIPILGFLLLDIFTLGCYRIYWSYYNWKAIKKADHSDISPFWRAIFGVFFAQSLFKRISDSIKTQYPTRAPFHHFWSIAYISIFAIDKAIKLFLIFDGSIHALILSFWLFIFLKDLMVLPIQQAINFYQAKLEEERLVNTTSHISNPIKYFDISPLRFLILNLLTTRLYSLYWSFKNWKAINRVEKRNIIPFWRGIFSIFFIDGLFRKIYLSAKSQGYLAMFSYRKLAVGYILLTCSLPLLGRFLEFSINISQRWYYVLVLVVGVAIDFIFLRPIQQAISFYNSKAIPDYKPKLRLAGIEICLLVMGIIFYILLFTGRFETSQLTSNSFVSRFNARSIQWSTFQPDSKKFQVKFPINPIHEKGKIRIDRNLSAYYEGYESTDSKGVIYSVSHVTYPAEIQLSDIELTSFIDDIVESSYGNKLVSSENILIGDHPAVDFVVQSRAAYMKGIITRVGQIKYLVMCTYVDSAYNEKDYKRFIDSFRLETSL